jgi:predicted PurR-regulated permease PerM
VGGIVGIYLSVPLVAALRVVYRRFVSPPIGSPLRSSFAECLETRGETSVVA